MGTCVEGLVFSDLKQNVFIILTRYRNNQQHKIKELPRAGIFFL